VTPPILTIGLPVYNGAKFVSTALDSLLAQNYRNFVLLISDNASTDGTSEILASYAERDPRIEVVHQPNNLGALANFRYLLDRCETKYFCWAAADDVLSRDWLEKLMPVATSVPCIAFGTIQAIDSKGERLSHPANNRQFTFGGPRLWRRLKYFITPGLCGKATPIYGIFPIADFTPEAWHAFESNGHAGDVAALHVLLAGLPISSRTDTVLFKRRHADNAATQPIAGSKRQKPWFRKTMLPIFWRQSKLIERSLLVMSYPIAELGTVTAKLNYLRLRSAERLSAKSRGA